MPDEEPVQACQFQLGALQQVRMEEETRDIYRAGMAAFEGIAPEYHIELKEDS